jgi:signal transduction histidine kinase/ActR/RegA family two-component response regulator
MHRWILDLPLRMKFLAVPLIAIVCMLCYLSFHLSVTLEGDRRVGGVLRSQLPALERIAGEAVSVAALSERVLDAVRLAERDGPGAGAERLPAGALPAAVERLAGGVEDDLDRIARELPELRVPAAALDRELGRFLALARARLEDGPGAAGLDTLVTRAEAVQARHDELLEAAYLHISATLDGAQAALYRSWVLGLVATTVLIFVLLGLTHALSNGVLGAVGYAVARAGDIARGEWDAPVRYRGRDELARLLRALETMRRSLSERAEADREREEEQLWAARLADAMRGDPTPVELGRRILACFSNSLGIRLGALYLHEAGELILTSAYALDPQRARLRRVHVGDGLLGQAAQQRTQLVLDELPDDYLPLESGLGRTGAAAVVITPIEHENRLVGLLELGATSAIPPRVLAFLERAAPGIGIALQTSQSRVQLADYADTLRRQQEQLHDRQAQLEQTNQVLEERTQRLVASEAKLREQQDALRASNEALEAQASQLQQSNRYKSQFLSTVSHELRTPLNSILILSSILQENPDRNLSPKQLQQLGVVHSAGNDLLHLINDILDMSKIEEGKLRTVRETLRLDHLVERMEAAFRHVAENRGLAYRIQVDPGLPESMETDQQRLEQILRNLLANAFKFTERGSVTLALERDGEDGVRFRVTDTGIGIAGEQQDEIFEAFQQAEGTISRRFGGTGLGLSISRDLAAALGGTVALARSTKDQGSEFTLSLPRVAPEAGEPDDGAPNAVPEGAGPEPARAAEGSGSRSAAVADGHPGDGEGDGAEGRLRGCRVLLVDDDMRNLFSLTSVLENAGAEVTALTSGLECLEHLRQGGTADVVVMDVMMPELDGIETTRRLRAELGVQVPVLMATAKTSRGLREECLSAGADDFLSKPLEIPTLLASVEDWWQCNADVEIPPPQRGSGGA